MVTERVISMVIFSFVGIAALAMGMFIKSLHKVYVQKAKQRKKKAGRIYLLGSTPFFGLAVSTLLFSASFGTQLPIFGWIGYGATMVTIMLSFITLSALKKYPEPDQSNDEGSR